MGGKIISHIYGGKKKRCGCGEREQLQFPHDKKQLHSFPNVILSGRKLWLHLRSPTAPSDGPGGTTGPREGNRPSCFAALTWHGFDIRVLAPGELGQEDAEWGEKEG